MRVWNGLMEANIANTMEVNCCWIGIDHVDPTERAVHVHKILSSQNKKLGPPAPTRAGANSY